MATVNKINRIRIILDLLKDGEVVNSTPYGSLELFDAVLGTKYIQGFYVGNNGPQLFEVDGVTPRNPTNDEYADFIIKSIRDYLKGTYVRGKHITDGQQAINTIINDSRAEADSELGVNK